MASSIASSVTTQRRILDCAAQRQLLRACLPLHPPCKLCSPSHTTTKISRTYNNKNIQKVQINLALLSTSLAAWQFMCILRKIFGRCERVVDMGSRVRQAHDVVFSPSYIVPYLVTILAPSLVCLSKSCRRSANTCFDTKTQTLRSMPAVSMRLYYSMLMGVQAILRAPHALTYTSPPRLTVFP